MEFTNPLVRFSSAHMTGLLTVMVALSGCLSQPHNATPKDIQACSALQNVVISANEFGLPTGKATIQEAVLLSLKGRDSAVNYCRVRGSIAPADAANLSIKFQVNLPAHWNGKAIQNGGGGSNGVVVESTGHYTHAPSTALSPLGNGYVTFGGDSGHTMDDKDWVNNEQAYRNYAGEGVKRTHDAAMSIIKHYYGKAPKYTYFIGGSKGGQEGLVAAQRYGSDYNGVISFYPAARAFAMQMAWGRMGYAASAPGADLSWAEQAWVKSKVMEACDGLDGVRDGLIGRVEQCRQTFNLQSLRCADASSRPDRCLSNAQIKGLATGASPLVFDFPLANGVTSIGPFPILEGANFGWLLYPTMGTPWAKLFVGAGDDIAKQASDGAVTKMPDFDYRRYRDKILSLSQTYDVSSTDLEAFKRNKGKLLMIQGTADMLVPQSMTTEYYHSLRKRYGADLDKFAAYYIQPGFDHGNGDFTLAVDSLAALENWVEKGEAPGTLLAVDEAKATSGRTRPLCKYPEWAKYKGSGDIHDASSFECVNE